VRRLAVLGTIGISFSAILVRLADVSAATAGFYRMAYAVPILLLLSLLFRTESFAPLRPYGWLAGAIFALNLFLWHLSIGHIGAGLATVLGNTQVIFIALLGWLLLSERPSRTAFLVLPLLLGGVVLLTGLGGDGYGSNPVLGVLFGALSGLTSAAYVLVFRHASRQLPTGRPAIGLLLQTSLGGALASVLIGALSDPGFSLQPVWPGHGWLLLLALSAQVAGWLLLGQALRALPALETAIIMLLQPILALVWGSLIFGESLSLLQAAGVTIVLLGIVLLNTTGALRKRTPRAAVPVMELPVEPSSEPQTGLSNSLSAEPSAKPAVER
jgi:drug/metabolite transporter (DMT)-like permease